MSLPPNLEKAQKARLEQAYERASVCCAFRFGILSKREAQIFMFAREGGRRLGYTVAMRKAGLYQVKP